MSIETSIQDRTKQLAIKIIFAYTEIIKKDNARHMASYRDYMQRYVLEVETMRLCP